MNLASILDVTWYHYAGSIFGSHETVILTFKLPKVSIRFDWPQYQAIFNEIISYLVFLCDNIWC